MAQRHGAESPMKRAYPVRDPPRRTRLPDCKTGLCLRYCTDSVSFPRSYTAISKQLVVGERSNAMPLACQGDRK